MRTYFILFGLVALPVLTAFCGCGKAPGRFGNFADVESVELVQDAMSALNANYLPAKTRLILVMEVEDAFGTSLVESMRAEGYAVAEYDAPAKGDKYALAVAKPDGLAFAYMLDGKGDELRVLLHVGDETLSRMYRVQRSGDELRYIPQGFLARRQQGDPNV